MNAPSPAPPDQPGGQRDTLAVAICVGLLVLLALALVTPIVVVAGAAMLVARWANKRVLAALVGASGALAALVGLVWPGWRRAGLRYASAYKTVEGAIHSHHVTTSLVLGQVPRTLWVAVPVGLLVGLCADVARRRGGVTKGKPGQKSAQSGPPKAPVKRLSGLVVARRHPPGDRVALGTLGGRLLASEVDRHTLIVAPTRSGKTRGVIMPALLSWQGPLVATSSKSDILSDPQWGSGAYAYRASLGRPAWVYDPSGSSGWPSVAWSPLGRSIEWQGALRAAYAMAWGSGERGRDSTAAYFAARAAAVLAPVLHAVALAEGGMRDVAEMVRGMSLDDLADSLEQGLAAGGACAEAHAAVDALRSGSETSSGDTRSTLANILGPFVDDPEVAASTDDCDFSPADLIETKGSLFIVSGADSTRLAPLFAALVDEIFAYVQERALRDGPLDPRLLLALDEVATIAPIPALPQRLATVAGQGVTCLLAFQTLGQLKRWGDDAPSEILGNVASQLWTATDDPGGSDHLTKLLGHQQVHQVSVSAPAKRGLFSGAPDPSSTTTSATSQAVLDPSQLRLLEGPLLVHAGLPPTEVEWRFHDEDRRLSRRSRLPMPELELETEEAANDNPAAAEPPGEDRFVPDAASAPEPVGGAFVDPEPGSDFPGVVPGPVDWWAPRDTPEAGIEVSDGSEFDQGEWQ